MNRSTFTKSLLAVSVMAALSGCASVTVDEVKKKSEKEFDRIERTYKQGNKIAPKASSISYMDGFYIAEKPYKMADREVLPSFFNEEVSFSSQDPTSFQRLTSLVSEKIGIRISYTDDATQYLENWMTEGSGGEEEGEVAPLGGDSAIPNLPSNPPAEDDPMAAGESVTSISNQPYGNLPGSTVTFTLEHDGTLAELMDNLTGRVGLFWKWKDNEIVIFMTESKNITVDIDAISQSFTASIKSQTSFVGDSGSGSGGAGQGMESTFDIEGKPKLERLQEVIESTILTENGSIEIFEDFGIVSIRDLPPNVKKAEEFLEEINNIATRQIVVKVDVVTVTKRSDAAAGFDWDAVYNGISGMSAGFTANLFEGDGNLQIGVIDTDSAFSGTSGFIRALDQYADVSSHYSGFAHTTNGTMAPITDSIKEDYIKSITIEKGEEGESDSMSTEIGEAKTGIDMMVIPRISSKDEVSLNVKYDLNELISMKTTTAGDNTISLPTSSIKGSYIRAVIESGKTYMVAGTSSKKTKVDTASVLGDDSAFSWLFGGKKEAISQDEYSILMITPYIMGD